ncbi:MAG: CapA family protein, partial [Clostridia bacterium]|nr:CapA family protein [Clostridia bacterium]
MRNNKRGKRRYSGKRIDDINKKDTKKLLSITLAVLLVILVFIAVFYAVKNSSNYKKLVASYEKEINLDSTPTEKDTNTIEKEEIPADTTFKLTAIGDVMCHNTQYWDAYNKDSNTYDFSYVFEDISYYTKTSDIVVGSLETSFAGEDRGYSNYPIFNSPDALAYSLKDIGVDVLSTAGNHCLDMGFSGLSRTIDVLSDADIAHLGTYKTAEDQDKILYKYVKGVKIAFINYTYGTNGIPVPSDKPFCVNLIDKDLIKKHIAKAKEENADVIVACMHWGVEYKTVASTEQEELADFLFKNGVNIILGNHPHVLEQMEKRTVTLDDGT